MKRSPSVRLTLMSAAAVTATGLAGCGSEVASPGNFTTLDACIQAGNTSAACTRAREEALKGHAEKAPRYASREECLQRVDVVTCDEMRVPGPGGSMATMFIPAIAGFVLGRQLQSSSGGGGGGYGAFYASRDYPGQYRDPGNLTTSRSLPPGSAVTAPGRGGPPATAPTTPSRPPNVNTTTIARGGFGSTSGSVGSASG